jgi:hypothetical protein
VTGTFGRGRTFGPNLRTLVPEFLACHYLAHTWCFTIAIHPDYVLYEKICQAMYLPKPTCQNSRELMWILLSYSCLPLVALYYHKHLSSQLEFLQDLPRFSLDYAHSLIGSHYRVTLQLAVHGLLPYYRENGRMSHKKLETPVIANLITERTEECLQETGNIRFPVEQTTPFVQSTYRLQIFFWLQQPPQFLSCPGSYGNLHSKINNGFEYFIGKPYVLLYGRTVYFLQF